MYITSAQLRLANTGHAPAWMLSRAEGERKGWAGTEDEMESVEDEDRARRERGWIESLARASMTRAKTYITI